MEMYSPTALESAPATRLAKPASRTMCGSDCAPATPRMSATWVTRPSLMPSTAARAAPLWTSRARCRASSATEILEPGKRGVLGREQRFLHRPVDAGRIPQDADLVRAVVEIGALVLDLGDVAQHAEPVREPRRDEHLAEVLLGKHRGGPAAEGLRAGAAVDRGVEDLPTQGAHQLPLRPGAPRGEPAQAVPARALGGVRHGVGW